MIIYGPESTFESRHLKSLDYATNTPVIGYPIKSPQCDPAEVRLTSELEPMETSDDLEWIRQVKLHVMRPIKYFTRR